MMVERLQMRRSRKVQILTQYDEKDGYQNHDETYGETQREQLAEDDDANSNGSHGFESTHDGCRSGTHLMNRHRHQHQ